MENKSNNVSASKKVEVLKEIAELEAEIAAVKAELHIVENDEKLENQKKNVLEVNKDVLCRSIEFYRNKAKKMRHSLSNQQAKYSKFSTAGVCYDKLLEVYRETYLRESAQICSKQTLYNEKSNSIVDSHTQIEVLQKQFEELQSRLDENFKMTKALLEDLQYATD